MSMFPYAELLYRSALFVLGFYLSSVSCEMLYRHCCFTNLITVKYNVVFCVSMAVSIYLQDRSCVPIEWYFTKMSGRPVILLTSVCLLQWNSNIIQGCFFGYGYILYDRFSKPSHRNAIYELFTLKCVLFSVICNKIFFYEVVIAFLFDVY